MTAASLLLDDAGSALVEGLLINCLIDAAVELDKLDRKRNPVEYPAARLKLTTAAIVLAQLVGPTPAPALRSKGDPLGFDFQMKQEVAAAGIDQTRELESVDPRSIRPKCTHGKYFSEPCETCDAAVIELDDSLANNVPTLTDQYLGDSGKLRAKGDDTN
jgi:hypothetical protein